MTRSLRRTLTSPTGARSCRRTAGAQPTDMPILNDAGAAAYPRELIEDRMAREGICMANVLTGEAFGQAVRGPAS
jgi:hypothetical protein